MRSKRSKESARRIWYRLSCGACQGVIQGSGKARGALETSIDLIYWSLEVLMTDPVSSGVFRWEIEQILDDNCTWGLAILMMTLGIDSPGNYQGFGGVCTVSCIMEAPHRTLREIVAKSIFQISKYRLCNNLSQEAIRSSSEPGDGAETSVPLFYWILKLPSSCGAFSVALGSNLPYFSTKISSENGLMH